MKLNSLPKTVLLVWEILSIILVTVLFSVALIILNPHTIVWYIVLWIIGAFFILLCALYCPLLYISYKYSISKDIFILKRGVIFNKTHIINKNHISYISVTKNPFTKITKLSTLTIVAPRARVIIPLMSHEKNTEILTQLSSSVSKKGHL